jgi:hypothetical protein
LEGVAQVQVVAPRRRIDDGAHPGVGDGEEKDPFDPPGDHWENTERASGVVTWVRKMADKEVTPETASPKQR